MGLIEIFKNKVLFLYTAPLIYFMENSNPDYTKIMREFFKQAYALPFQPTTSTITVTEILVKPYKKGRSDLIEKFKSAIVNSKTIKICNIDSEPANKAAELRANHNLKTPDALQIAAALNNKCDFFITNDFELSRINEIEVLTLNDLKRKFLK